MAIIMIKFLAISLALVFSIKLCHHKPSSSSQYITDVLDETNKNENMLNDCNLYNVDIVEDNASNLPCERIKGINVDRLLNSAYILDKFFEIIPRKIIFLKLFTFNFFTETTLYKTLLHYKNPLKTLLITNSTFFASVLAVFETFIVVMFSKWFEISLYLFS